MSYLVLARKWRPQGFDDLIGQEPITQILKNSIEQNKIAHAYIFSGPRGVGKTSTARILAKALNCEKGPTPSPCNSCQSCIAVKDGSSIDVLEIDGASNNSVDDIRSLRESVKYTPLGGRYKIYIIDEAHMLSTSAFNALLKTLEEPPAHAIFVLATTASQKIPVTIFSRCQHLPFKRISTHKIKERLKNIAESESIKITDSSIDMIARTGDGSMRDSLTILDQVTAFSSDIKESEVKDLLGITDVRMLSGIASAVIKGNQNKIISSIADLVDKGTDLKTFMKDLVGFFRDLLVAKITGSSANALELSEDEKNIINEMLPEVSSDTLTIMLSEMIKAESDVRSAFSPRLNLEMSLIKASFLSSMKPVKEAIENIEAFLKNKPVSSEAQSARPDLKKTAPVLKQPDIQQPSAADEAIKKNEISGDIDAPSLLKMILEKIDDPRISSKLAKAKPAINENILILNFNSSEAEIFADAIRKNASLIEKTASDIRNKKTKIEIKTHIVKTVKKSELMGKALADPNLREVVDLFEGRIIDVKLKENMGGEQ